MLSISYRFSYHISTLRKKSIIQLYDEVVEVNENPRLEQFSNRGNLYWRIEIGKTADGKRVRPSLGPDEKYARSFYAEILERLGCGDIKGVRSAVNELNDLDSKAARKVLHPYGQTSLLEVAQWWTKFRKPPKDHVTLTQALEKWHDEAIKAQHSDTYIKKMLNTYAGPFVREYPKLRVMDLTYKEAERYIFKVKKGLSNSSKGETIRKLRGWFNALADMKYAFRELNPFNDIKAPKDKFGVNEEEVERTVSPRFMQVMLDYALESQKQSYIEVLTTIVLRAFCGVRSEEVVKLDWKNITLRTDSEKPTKIVVRKLASKMGYKRDIVIPENARCWLIEASAKTKNPSGPLIKNWRHGKGTERSTVEGYLSRMNDFHKDLKKHCEENKITCWEKYEQNGFRVSCASYGLHHFGKEMICRMMGEKRDAVFWNNYQEYVDEESATRYFQVYPQAEIERRREIDEMLFGYQGSNAA